MFWLQHVLSHGAPIREPVPCTKTNVNVIHLAKRIHHCLIVPQVDVFSMGCCLFVMITGIFPIDGKSMDEIAERACKPVDFDDEWPWGFFSTDLKDLLAGMLEVCVCFECVYLG